MAMRGAGEVARGLVWLLPAPARALLLLVAVLRLVERIAVVAIATGLWLDRKTTVVAAAAGLAVLFAIRSAVRSAATRSSKAAFARLVVSRLLEGDVLAVVPTDLDAPVASTFEALFAAHTVLVDDLTALTADSVAAVGIAIGIVVKSHALIRIGPVALAAVGVGGILVGAAFALTARLSTRSTIAFGPVYTDIVTALGGRLDLVAAGQREPFLCLVDEHLTRWRAEATRSDMLSSLAGRAPVAATSLMIGFAIWRDSVSMGARGAIDFASVAVAASLASPFLGAARQSLQVARNAVRASPLLAIAAAADGPVGARRGTPLPSLPGHIRWQGVSFSYERGPSSRVVVDNASIDWPNHSVLTLGGPNGSGKSTILRLALGLGLTTRGEVTVAGTSVLSLDLEAWRRSIAYLPQRPYLGEEETAIRDAVRLLVPDASDSAIRDALEKVALWHPLSTGADDPLARKLRTLSAGQRQRLALARVLCQPTQVVILDEPDANLDREGVAMVIRVVRELRTYGMVAIAAHSPELLAIGDTAVLVECGRVIECSGAARGDLTV